MYELIKDPVILSYKLDFNSLLCREINVAHQDTSLITRDNFYFIGLLEVENRLRSYLVLTQKYPEISTYFKSHSHTRTLIVVHLRGSILDKDFTPLNKEPFNFYETSLIKQAILLLLRQPLDV